MNASELNNATLQQLFLSTPYPALLISNKRELMQIVMGNYAFLNASLMEQEFIHGKVPDELFAIENKRPTNEQSLSFTDVLSYVVKTGQSLHLDNKGLSFTSLSGMKQLLFVGTLDITPIRIAENPISHIIISILPANNNPLEDIAPSHKDETEKLKHELEISDRHLSNIIEGAVAGTWDWDIRTGDVKRKGKIFDEFLGKNSNQFHIPNNTWQCLIHPDDQARVVLSNEKALADPEIHFWEEDFRLKTIHNTYQWIKERGYILRDKSGRAIRALGATQNITEKHNYIEAIEEQNARLREIAWMQSHVVRAPLARMMGIVDVVQSVEISHEEFKAFTRHFIESAKELDAIIHEISFKTLTQQRQKQ